MSNAPTYFEKCDSDRLVIAETEEVDLHVPKFSSAFPPGTPNFPIVVASNFRNPDMYPVSVIEPLPMCGVGLPEAVNQFSFVDSNLPHIGTEPVQLLPPNHLLDSLKEVNPDGSTVMNLSSFISLFNAQGQDFHDFADDFSNTVDQLLLALNVDPFEAMHIIQGFPQEDQMAILELRKRYPDGITLDVLMQLIQTSG